MDDLFPILQLPERCLVNKKITKAFFKRNFDLTSAEKTLLDDAAAITNIDWLATISTANANIVRHQDEQWLYEEVQIISVQTGETDFDRNQSKIAELLQKYIPYPILLCIYHSQAFRLNTAEKKVNRNDNDRRTIDKRYTSDIISRIQPDEPQQSFLASLNFGELDKLNLKTFYDSYSQRIIALRTAEVSGHFVPRTSVQSKADFQKLEEIESMNKEISRLENDIKKESQFAQRVSLNVSIQTIKNQIKTLRSSLSEF